MAQKTKAQKTTETKKPSKTKTVKSASTTTSARKSAPKAAAAKKTGVKAAAAPAKKPTVAKAKTTAATKAAAKPAAAKAKAPAAKKATAKPRASTAAPAQAKAKTTSATRRASAPVRAAGSSAKPTPAAAKAASGKAAPAKATRAVAASVTPAASTKVSAPVAKAKIGSRKVMSPKAVAEKAVANREAAHAAKRPLTQKHGFKTAEFVVYPAHGVGQIVGIEEQEIAGIALELFVITFEKEKLTLRVPTGKLESVGMRKLSDEAALKKAMDILKGRARVKRTMWSRRAQEYVAKITSGDLVSIAEVVRDLYRSEAQPEQSYSERQLYEDALDRMARELAAVEKLDERGAVQRIVEVLSKSAKGRRIAEEEAAEAEAASASDTQAA
ncbi:MAG: CarD family transcriptional regulator [Pseudomonadota bacterium]